MNHHVALRALWGVLLWVGQVCGERAAQGEAVALDPSIECEAFLTLAIEQHREARAVGHLQGRARRRLSEGRHAVRVVHGWRTGRARGTVQVMPVACLGRVL